MRQFIGMSLQKVQEYFSDKKFKIIYNTNNQKDIDRLYVTNVAKKNGIYFIVVSDFIIEVK